MSEPPIRVRATVRGRVQQVGFRVFVLRHAERAGLNGRVANLPDGGLEVLVEGAPSAVEALVRSLHQGPTFARVDTVETRQEPAGSPLPPMRITA